MRPSPAAAIPWFRSSACVITAIAVASVGCGSRTGVSIGDSSSTADSSDATAVEAGHTDTAVVNDAPQDGPVERIGVTQARFPWNGFATGSVWGARRGPEHHTSRRPTFQWEAVEGADHYELRLDSTCSDNATCTFTSARTYVFETTRATIQEDLPVSETAPVGTRYYWAVRACGTLRGTSSTCSEWTATRYLDVGRQRGDYDGDGWGDAIIGAPSYQSTTGVRQSAYFVYRGSMAGLELEPTLRILADVEPVGAFGGIANVGDLNADGYGDVAMLSSYPAMRPRRNFAVHVHYGGADGLAQAPSVVVHASEPICSFRQGPVGAGDLNGDGFSDFAVASDYPRDCGTNGEGGDAVHIYHGQSQGVFAARRLRFDGPFSSSGRTFSTVMGGAGDVDGDGYPDFAVAIVDFLRHRPAHVFTGGPQGLSAAAAYEFLPPSSLETRPAPRYYFPAQLPSVGDMDGDGFADLVGTQRQVYDSDPPGQVHTFSGLREGIPRRPSSTVPNPVPMRIFADAISGGDLNADGLGDIAIAAGELTDRHLQTHFGGAAGLDPTGTPLQLPVPPPRIRVYSRISSPADFDGDGTMDLVVGVPDGQGPGSAFIYRTGPDAPAGPVAIPNPTGQTREHFGAIIADTTL